MYLLTTGTPLPDEVRSKHSSVVMGLIKTARGSAAKYIPLVKTAIETDAMVFEVVRSLQAGALLFARCCFLTAVFLPLVASLLVPCFSTCLLSAITVVDLWRSYLASYSVHVLEAYGS